MAQLLPGQPTQAVPKLPKANVVKKIPKNFVHHEGWGDLEVGSGSGSGSGSVMWRHCAGAWQNE